MKLSKLLALALVLLISVGTLAGSTIAWFTDSVTSASNVIKSGNLDVEVEYTLDGEKWENLDGANDLFQKGLWEPGHTEVVVLKVTNKGSLALKYSANMNIIEEISGKTKEGNDIVLSDILTVSALTFAESGVDPVFGINIAEKSIEEAFKNENGIAYDAAVSFKNGNILENNEKLLPGDVEYVAIKVDMAETVGNEANHNGTDIPSIEFGVNVLATQYTYEEDSFGSDYDKDAKYPVSSVAEFKAAIEKGGMITLTEDIELPEEERLNIEKETVINLNGNTLTVYELEAKADTTIIGGKIDMQVATYPQLSVSAGTLHLKDVEVVNKDAYCNIIWNTNHTQSVAEFTVVEIWGGKCILDNCNITAEVTQKRYSNSVFGIGIHGGELEMNGGSIAIKNVGSTRVNYEAAIFAGSAPDKKITLNNVTIADNAKKLFAWGGNTVVYTTDAEGSWTVDTNGGMGTYTINYPQ